MARCLLLGKTRIRDSTNSFCGTCDQPIESHHTEESTMKQRSLVVCLMTLSVFCLIAMAAMTAFGQTSKGTITGLVTDQNGAVIAGAEVEIKNAATNQVRSTTANDAGLYRLDAVD